MNEELIYLYRRKGNEAWATCDADRYAELSGNHFFEVRVARHQHDYAAIEAECERLRAEAEALWSTYIALVDKLGIDTEKAKTADGKPSDVIVSYVEALRDENARLRAELERNQ